MKLMWCGVCLAASCAVWGQEVKVRQGMPLTKTLDFVAMEDVEGKAVTGAPYSAKAVTKSTQTLADGNRIVNTTEVLLARDSQGRTRREQKLNAMGPWTAEKETSVVTITDPTSKATVVVGPNGQSTMRHSTVATTISGGSGGAVALHAPDGAATFQHRVEATSSAKAGTVVFVNGGLTHAQARAEDEVTEDLGSQVIEGVLAQGKRTRSTIPAGKIGNERPINIVSESWFSPELQMVVLSKRSDPRTGESEFRLTEISRAEPSASLFEKK
jgi:hypothetical protein